MKPYIYKYSFLYLIVITLGIVVPTQAQVVYQDVSKTSIYTFLDELANDKIIEINSVIKPYSRKFIYEKLIIAKEKKEYLSKRQLEEVEFFLLDYALDFNKSLPTPKPNIDFLKRKEVLAAINPVGYGE